jgi:hypothetical protein
VVPIRARATVSESFEKSITFAMPAWCPKVGGKVHARRLVGEVRTPCLSAR